MKKQNQFDNLSLAELYDKKKIILKQSVMYNLSMDSSLITEANNSFELKKQLKSISRRIACLLAQNKMHKRSSV